ncbi:MAG: DUF1003 domain-containing protein [Chloroflexota bacterium]
MVSTQPGRTPDSPRRTEGARRTDFERRLLARVREKRLARALQRPAEAPHTFGQRVADLVADTIGSWRFIIIQSAILAVWIAVNVVSPVEQWDPYPFILLNLMLSFQAAYAGPVIMMSQNRQADRDRRQASLDLETDLKAETLVEELLGNLEDLRLTRWEELLEIQQRQIDMLTDLVERATGAELPESSEAPLTPRSASSAPPSTRPG